MSRFFAAGSDSESSKSSNHSSSSGSDSDSDSSVQSDVEVKKGYDEFLLSSGDEGSESGGDVKIIKSQKDKRYDEMRACMAKMSNFVNIQDWVHIQNEFDRMQKLLVKAGALITEEGLPRFYIRNIVDLEDSLSKTIAKKPKLNQSTQKAVNAMKQKLKKLPFQDRLEAFRADPVTELDSQDEMEELAEKNAQEAAEKSRRAKASKKKAVAFKEEEEEMSDTGFQKAGKKSKPIEKLTSARLFESLQEILEARGKKSTVKGGQIELLVQLLSLAVTPFQKIKCVMSLIPARFDLASSSVMSTEMWKAALEEIKTLHLLLEENPHIQVKDEQEVDISDATKDASAEAGEYVVLRGVITSFCDKLDDEFTKALQNIDPNSTEYIDRLKDEFELYTLIVKAQDYAAKVNMYQDGQDLILLRRVEHLYYKPAPVIETFEANAQGLISKFCTILSKSNIERVVARALLCNVYYLALQDDFYAAHEQLLMSHLQESLKDSDIATQTLYNRTLVQVGLCAFRTANFAESHYLLHEISASSKTRELLGQGSSQKYAEKTAEQEKIEKARQMPFHMHVNLELLEACYLTCAMVLEVPNMAQYCHDSRRKVISKPFRRLLDYNERQLFTGPPENIRDHVMAAAKAMQQGHWSEAKAFIDSIKIWDLLSNAAQVKPLLFLKIQEESLRSYLFSYAPYYDNFGIDHLSTMFSLSKKVTTTLVSKMIGRDELKAYISEDMVIMDKELNEITRLEYLAQTYTDKLYGFMDTNEKLLEAKMAIADDQVVPTRMFRGKRK